MTAFRTVRPLSLLAFALALATSCTTGGSLGAGEEEPKDAAAAVDAKRAGNGGAGKGGNAGQGGAADQSDASGASGQGGGQAGAGADAAADAPAGGAGGSAAGPDAGARADAVGAGGPVKVFIDTDLVQDPGDVSALTYAHALADQCDISIIGVTVVSTSVSAAPAADAINTYYGRPDIPLGVLKGGNFLTRRDYSDELARMFPVTRYKSNADAPDATTVFREVLAKQPDGSVVVVSIGPLRNLARFLASPADAVSPLSGKELIAKKVTLLSAMAGVFTEISAFEGPVKSEYNVKVDAPSARAVVDGWPSPIMFSGFEVGWFSCVDGPSMKADPKSPLTVAAKSADADPCASKGRPAWDQTSLLYAAHGLQPFWQGEMKGQVTIDGSGANKWSATPDRGQGFLVNKGINNKDNEPTNQAKLASTLTKAIADLQAKAGISGACRAKK